MANWLGRLGARLFGRYFGGADAPAPRPWRRISGSNSAAFSLAPQARQAWAVKAATRSAYSLVTQTWRVFADVDSRSARRLAAATAPPRLSASSRAARALLIEDRAVSLSVATVATTALQPASKTAQDLQQKNAASGALEST